MLEHTSHTMDSASRAAKQGACLFFLLFALASPIGLAQAVEQERILDSTRFLARGNTYVAATDSDEATRANPATLAEPKLAFQLRFLQMDLFVGQNTMNSVSDVANVDGEASAVALLETFRDKFGKRQYGRVQFMPLATRIFAFEISPFVSSSNFIDMRLPTTPTVEFESHTISGVNLSYAQTIGKETLVGLTLRPAHRQRFRGDIAFANLLEFVDSDAFQLDDVFEREEGFIVGADLGVIWRKGKNWRFGLVGENLGHAANNAEFQNTTSPLAQRINLGMDYRYEFKPWYWDWLFDIQNIDQAWSGQRDPFRSLHLGTELGVSYVSRDTDLGLALGINDGYFTSGLYADFYVTRLNLSYYAVELGQYAGQRKDRRWGATLVSSMTF